MRTFIVSMAVAVALSGCEQEQTDPAARWTGNAAPADAPVAVRWYTQVQVSRGAGLYRQHCASCQKDNAEGTADWRKRDANGKFPPPPLNGTAHAWHHPLQILRTVVIRGGKPVGGSMPAFGDKLDGEQIDAILAWVQSHWSDEIYSLWRQRELASRKGPQAAR